MYIENNLLRKHISLWLMLMFFLIAFMIVVGGLTRLTDSGLSITKWELFSGTLPPLSDAKWLDYFEEYKKTQNKGLFFKNLYKIGYRYLNSKYKTKIIKNFQRKYRQKKINGIIDCETFKLSQILSKSSN